MNTDGLDRLRDYWDRLRAGRSAPLRAELDPREFDDMLGAMFILEQVTQGQVRVRLGGQQLCEMMGMEVRGMPPEAFIDAHHRLNFQSHLQSVLNGPAVAELELGAVDAKGRKMKAHMLLLPLRSDFGEISRIIGAIAVEHSDMRVPANFTINDVRISPVHGDDAPVESLPGFEEPAPTFAGPAVREVVDNPAPIVSRPRRGHLRVVRGD